MPEPRVAGGVPAEDESTGNGSPLFRSVLCTEACDEDGFRGDGTTGTKDEALRPMLSVDDVLAKSEEPAPLSGIEKLVLSRRVVSDEGALVLNSAECLSAAKPEADLPACIISSSCSNSLPRSGTGVTTVKEAIVNWLLNYRPTVDSIALEGKAFS